MHDIAISSGKKTITVNKIDSQFKFTIRRLMSYDCHCYNLQKLHTHHVSVLLSLSVFTCYQYVIWVDLVGDRNC